MKKWSHRQDLHPAPAHTKGAHRFLCFGGKLRHAGDAPAHPRWQRGVLLIDECRDKWSGGKVLPPRELGVGQPCYCYITAGCSKVAAGVGIAPTSRALQTRAHLSMPSSEKICVREELHLRCLPKGPGFTDQGDTSGSRLARLLKLVRDVGLAPTLRASQARVRTGYTIPWKMVGLAGLAPAIPCSQGRCVGYYATARNSCQATGCIRSPTGHDCSLAREVAGTKIGPHGTICTRTGPGLSRMPLLLGYAG